jgi:AcrR family transcriptional regulator
MPSPMTRTTRRTGATNDASDACALEHLSGPRGQDALDRQTRERLLATAAQLFAVRGFARVTVREICHSARANVAAINYHFGGKKGLYDQVIGVAIERMQSTTVAIQEAGATKSAEEQLAWYVSIFLTRVVADRDNWIHQLMMRELADPTAALDQVLAQVVQPRMAYLRTVVASLLDCSVSDARVERCAMSVHAQCLAPLTRSMGTAETPATPYEHVDALARHITQFSLAGILDLRT